MAFRPRDLADRMAGRRKPDDGYLRETFTLPRDKARIRARDFLTRYPKAAYMSSVESWRELLMATSNSPCGGCRARTDVPSGAQFGRGNPLNPL
jgi:hypothetical protein